MRTAGPVVLIAAVVSAAGVAADSFEKPKTFKASEILSPEELKGEHHAVKGKVPVEGYHYSFELETDFGDLEPIGHDLLRKRIRETAALEALNEVSKTGVFLKAAGRSLEDMGEGLVHVAEDPEGTVEGIRSGIKRFGVNLGRKTRRAYEDAKSDDPKKEETSTAEKTANVANAALGVNKSARLWAQKLQVDPYSRNPILQKALLEIGKLDAAAGIAVKVAVPIPKVVDATSSVGDLVWGQDPEAVRKANEAGLKALGVGEDVSARFFLNKAFTLTHQTRFVAALTPVKAEGLVDYVDAAARAQNPREGLFFVESAEMMQRLHGESPVKQVLEDSGAVVALSGGRAVVLLPLDYVSWTEQVAEVSGEVAERAQEELGASGLQMQVTGTVSKRARKELQARGWLVEEGAPGGTPNRR